ncbi:DUF4303 domain-containing protein [Aquimarina sp. 2201CG5-10]|uniref:DUF4303 domain-containing protein n=1 Tax=Aquimarina callyspongiae TaxID=3098150 RepID=UPI002AB52013|nr:DUF4303 domain-containing protein [Aquimarina sp. 2201CG5-10]MDY8136052.1 DUF4303 domain-containing protein [Aquimarina sp. 2201CG5-10]
MIKYNIEKTLANITKQIEEFAKSHKEENFYAFAVDAGMLCLSSEEGFNRIINTYSRDWQASHEKIILRKDLTKDEIEIIEEEFKSMPQNLLKIQNTSNLEEYINYYLKIENKVNQDALEKGNPYKKEEKITSLRYNPGDWPYQGFEKLNFEELDATYEEHYELNEKEQNNSEYSQFIKNLLNEIDQNSDKIFAPLNCTKDFKVLNAKHVL